eukprot:6192191-Pleurochrysis_carterae.AAC.1
MDDAHASPLNTRGTTAMLFPPRAYGCIIIRPPVDDTGIPEGRATGRSNSKHHAKYLALRRTLNFCVS